MFLSRNAVRALALSSFGTSLGDFLLRSTHTSLTVILIYDHALSLRREVRHVWPLRFSLPKLLFLLVSNPFVIRTLYLIQSSDPILSPSGILPRPSPTH